MPRAEAGTSSSVTDIRDSGDRNYEIVVGMRRFLSRDRRWRVDIIRLSCTADHRDGERFRIARDGYFVAEARTVEELSRHVDPAELEEA
jgi:hypothetical protein